MASLSPTTELEAVNACLLSIGQAPVSTLSVTGIQDVNLAKTKLAEATRRVALGRYNWNTDEGYPLDPDVDGVITIPPGVLEVDPEDPSVNIVARRHPGTGSMALYDKDRRSFVFTAPVPCKITWAFSFEDMPEAARQFIMVSAGRRFQAKVIGSQVLDSFEAEDETRAWVELQRTELRSRDRNLFRSNSAMSAFLNRRY